MSYVGSQNTLSLFLGNGEGGSGVIEGPGYVDMGNTRMAWGDEDSAGIATQRYTFPVSFSQPPSVVVNRLTPGVPLSASGTDQFGFSIDRNEAYMNPARFTWTAIGPITGGEEPIAGFNVPALPVWSAAVRAQRSGKRDARVLCIGDSVTAGNGSNGAGMVNNDIAASYPKLLSDRFTTRGSSGNWQSLVGTHNTTAFNTFDNRITSGASWAPTATARTAGGPTYFTKGTQTNFTFAPTQTWNAAEFYYTRPDAVNGTGLIVAVNGTDVGTFLAYNPPGYPNVSDPVIIRAPSVGANTISTRGVNVTDTFLLGIVTYRTDISQTLVMNAGWSGAKASDWLSDNVNSYGPMPVVKLYNPDLTIINLGINDAVSSTPTATFKSQMQSIITAVKATGSDIVLMIPNECNPTQVGTRLTELSTAISELGVSNGLPVVDMRQVLGTYAQATSAGYMRDNLHPNATGYGLEATAVANVVMPV